MNLSRISVENFRGITSTVVDFDHTTVLIGENDSGKSSLIDALAICFGIGAGKKSFAFGARDFRTHQTNTGERVRKPIRIELTLSDKLVNDRSVAADWSEPRFDPLRAAMIDGGPGHRRIILRVIAKIDDEAGQIKIAYSFLDLQGKAIKGANQSQLLGALRRLKPLLLMRSGLVVFGHGDKEMPVSSDQNGVPENEQDRQALVNSVEAYYRQVVLSGDSISDRELAAGFEAARQLVEQSTDVLSSAGHSSWLMQALARSQGPAGSTTPSDIADWLHGSGAQSIGLLLVIGALLEARTNQLDANADPVVIIEDPETHLHPLTLASAWDVIESIGWQKIVTTHAGQLMVGVPLRSIRRLVRRPKILESKRLGRYSLKSDELRKISYHIQAKRGSTLFLRCWLLVEGETEFWMLPHMAQLCGYDLAVEGVGCVEFSQCGVVPLVKLANDLGIHWHLLADGDAAGEEYYKTASHYTSDRPITDQITRIKDKDIENHAWRNGYAYIYKRAAGKRYTENHKRRDIIRRATRNKSKPHLALEVIEAAALPGSPGVPPSLRQAIESAVRLAREG